MKDINFFSVYDKRKNGAAQTIVRAVLIFVVVLVFVGGGYAALMFYNRGIINQTAEINAYLQSDEVVRTITAMEKYRQDKLQLDKYSALVDDVLSNLKASEHLNAARMDQISAALPTGAVMDSIDVAGTEVSFVFRVADVALATKLVYALSQLDCFESVSFMGVFKIDANITGPQVNYYSVEISAVLKGDA